MHYSLILSVVVASALVYLADAIDKTEAVGPCINGKCPDDHFCFEQECFPNRLQSTINKGKADSNSNLKAGQSIGSCVNGLCPNGYDCIDKNCYKSSKRSPQPIGPCINNLCPEGYRCNLQENKCYA